MLRRGSLLFVTSSLGQGGSEHKVVQLANALSEQGVEVGICHLNAPDTLASAVSPKVDVVCLERSGPFSVRTLRKLTALIRLRRVTTLVTVNLYPCLYGYLAASIVGRGSVRLVASINTTTFNSRREARKMAIYAPILRRFDLILFGAESQKKLWCASYGLGRNGQAAHVLYNGVDLAWFSRERASLARMPEWPSSRHVVGTVGAFRPEKRQSDLIVALSKLRDRGLDVGAVLVGNGPEKSAIERTIDSLGLADVVAVVGEVQDVRPYLAMMDIFVLPSVQVETFSNAALEAMAMSCPVVVTTVGGMPEMLSNGGGESYCPGDIGELVAHLHRLLTDDGLRRALGADARRIVESRFSLQAMVTRFKDTVWN